MGQIWEKYLDQKDLQNYSTSGFGKRYGIGKNPALVIVDVTYGFTGDKAEAIEESIKKYPASCGAASWEAIKHIQPLLQAARDAEIPIYYTIIEGYKDSSNDRIAIKGNIFGHPTLLEGEKGTWIVEEIKPLPGEIVFSKKKPSAFFGTPLITHLITDNIDSVIVVGCTTSGCIRSTVVDAFSYNFHVIVPEECVFDRSLISHAINLFDIQQKYGDVVPTELVIQDLKEKIKVK
ncbi:nicotinamidase-like amidase [Schinkia azotoformans MEV2011]|uniref:Nicotinamidase-like amidase n=1 Tax=Schinkia azotoformans MEV2011 TaxID=1348973 RepID=A0A072NFX3_SCHAZ|nr:isochorismatase family protein [Schinkia azotoformans]KEF36097.1 nicotinamidase-like amidase [Schinkia azotoformans MEV2011]MEC1695506.1 isochorismatase family protein [Schinkia azotoformans]MEC1718699.1 isochorismatase family protein [Schinkia azotoformans]MEC1727155.1 isochorismatase family protein [Schinkia azotoformans]MEC1743766.1 isochorismatase family protein [Schinkia azotoformans]